MGEATRFSKVPFCRSLQCSSIIFSSQENSFKFSFDFIDRLWGQSNRVPNMEHTQLH